MLEILMVVLWAGKLVETTVTDWVELMAEKSAD
jgi:hypothetical protein